jgi:hypothetical protein
MAYGRRLGIAREHGLICVLPAETEVGDQVSIFLGCPIPFVIRPHGDTFRLVGCCYVHDMMDGQAPTSPLWNVRKIFLR